MRQNRRSAIANSGTRATTSEQVAKDIHRSTREHHAAEENIGIVLDRLRGEYSIAEIQKLESMAGEISVGIVMLAAAKTERRLHFEEQERKRKAERLRREDVARKRYVEEKRMEGLTAILTELDELDRLRQFVAKLETAQPEAQSPRLSAFMDRARAHLLRREERLSSNSLEIRFAEERLFGEDDDKGFRPQIGYF